MLGRINPRGAMTKLLYYSLEVTVFELQSGEYVYSLSNIPHISTVMGQKVSLLFFYKDGIK